MVKTNIFTLIPISKNIVKEHTKLAIHFCRCLLLVWRRCHLLSLIDSLICLLSPQACFVSCRVDRGYLTIHLQSQNALIYILEWSSLRIIKLFVTPPGNKDFFKTFFRDPELSTVCRKSGTLILYPGAEAANLEEFILDSPIYPSTIIIIDGTWSQAKDIFYKNSLFRLPKQVNIDWRQMYYYACYICCL